MEGKKVYMIKYVIVILLIIGCIAAKMSYDIKQLKKRRIVWLLKKWGKPPEITFTEDSYQNMKKYYKSNKNLETDIDEITWNDIDMDAVYKRLNQTTTSIGEEYLYALLHCPVMEEKELKKRDKLIEFFQKNEKERVHFQSILADMGKITGLSFYDQFSDIGHIKTNTKKHAIMCGSFLMVLVLLVSSFITSYHAGLAGFFFVVMLVVNIVTYFKRKAESEKYYHMLSYVVKLLYSVSKLSVLDYEILRPYQKQFKEANRQFRTFSRRARFIMGGNRMSGSLSDVFMDYIRMLFHIDLIMFDFMVTQLEQSKNTIYSLYESIGYLDSMVAAASFRSMYEGDYCKPDLVKKDKLEFYTKKIYHPLIKEPVKNTITASGCILLTGSNASGKSTFIKTLAINAILAQTIYTCLAQSYHSVFFQVYSSMALSDNLMAKESYYIVEIRSLKRIIEKAKKDSFVLCFVDEVLRGTNTLERIAASSQILKYLSDTNVLCFAATHDIELTYMLERYYDNYHFEEQIQDKQVLFDYKLYKGRAVSRNAVKLLEMTGYPEKIVENAMDRVEKFQKNGIWKVEE